MTSVIIVNTIKKLCVGHREPHQGQEEGSYKESVSTNLKRLRNIQSLLLVAGGLFACLPVNSPHSPLLPPSQSCGSIGRLAESSRVTMRLMGGVSSPTPQFTSPCTFPLTAKEAAALSSSPANLRACGRKIIVFNHVLLVPPPHHLYLHVKAMKLQPLSAVRVLWEHFRICSGG